MNYPISKKFEIKGKRVYSGINNPQQKGYCLQLSSYGNFFSIPKSQVLSVKKISRPINEVANEDWFEFVVTSWIWKKNDLEEKISSMQSSKDALILD